MIDNTLAQLVPGAGRRKGTYPGRASNTISVTVVVSNLGRGAVMDRVEFFYSEATRMMEEVKERRMSRENSWENTVKAAGVLLPEL